MRERSDYERRPGRSKVYCIVRVLMSKAKEMGEFRLVGWYCSRIDGLLKVKIGDGGDR